MNQAEVGSVTAHPVVFAWKQVKGVLKTWAHARKQGVPATHWYGVYEAGTETVLAHTGCLPGAKERAHKLAAVLNAGD